MAEKMTENTQRVIELADISRTATNWDRQSSARAAIDEITSRDPEALNAALEKLARDEATAKSDKVQILSSGRQEIPATDITPPSKEQVAKDAAKIIEDAEISRTTANYMTQDEARSDIARLAGRDPEALKAALAKLDASQIKAHADAEQIKLAVAHSDQVSGISANKDLVRQVAEANLAKGTVNSGAAELAHDTKPAPIAQVAPREIDGNLIRKM